MVNVLNKLKTMGLKISENRSDMLSSNLVERKSNLFVL